MTLGLISSDWVIAFGNGFPSGSLIGHIKLSGNSGGGWIAAATTEMNSNSFRRPSSFSSETGVATSEAIFSNRKECFPDASGAT